MQDSHKARRLPTQTRQGVANIRSGGLSPRKHSPDGATAHIRLTGLLLIYRPWKDERLSWPSWLTSSGRFTHIVVTVGCKPSAGQGQFAGQRPAFCQLCFATNQLVEHATKIGASFLFCSITPCLSITCSRSLCVPFYYLSYSCSI